MKTRNFLLAGIITFSGMIALTSCENDDNDVSSEELSTETIDLVKESSTTEMIEEEIDASVSEAIGYSEEESSGLKSTSVESECATVTVLPEDGSFPKTITIDFGDGCEGNSGLTRSGSIIITITDTLRNPGAEYSTTFNNYTVENISVTGTKTVENTGTEDAPSFTEESDFSFTTPSNIVIDKQKSITRTWIEGMDTYVLVDDVFLISGSADVNSSSGRSYSYIITEPLKISRNCVNILEGEMEITWSGHEESVTIDYGDGECDWKVYVSRARRIIRRAVFLNN